MRTVLVLPLLLFCFLFLQIGNLSAKENGGIRSVAVTVSDLGNPYFIEIAKTIREHIRNEFGSTVTVTVKSNAYDDNRLKEQMKAFIEADKDLIVLVASDPFAIEPSIKEAQRAGIKVVAVDVNARGADVTVTTDNVQAGELACQHVADRLNGSGNIAIINGPPVSSVLERVAGCKSVLNNYPNLILLSDAINGDGSAEGGIKAMAKLLEIYPEIDAVFAINDPTAAGAAAMVEQINKDDLFIVSVDGSPSAISAFSDENPVWVATAAQFPRQMAKEAILLGIDIVNQKSLNQSTVLIPSQLITQGNLQSYRGWNQ